MTYDLLDSTTLASSASSVTFSSISQDYRDLVLVVDGVAVSGDTFLRPQMNGDTASNYSWMRMYGDGTTTSSSSLSAQTSAVIGLLETVQSVCIANFMDYSATDKHKSGISRANAIGQQVGAYAQRYASTSAITSLTIICTGSGAAAGSTFYLYGIKA